MYIPFILNIIITYLYNRYVFDILYMLEISKYFVINILISYI